VLKIANAGTEHHEALTLTRTTWTLIERSTIPREWFFGTKSFKQASDNLHDDGSCLP
jgi:hypothetical protein